MAGSNSRTAGQSLMSPGGVLHALGGDVDALPVAAVVAEGPQHGVGLEVGAEVDGGLPQHEDHRHQRSAASPSRAWPAAPAARTVSRAPEVDELHVG